MYALLPYVIHEHHAKHAGLHFDLRIKYPNKNLLASWALPKAKFPEKPGEKILALKVNDHGKYWLNVDSMEIPEGDHGHGHLFAVQKGVAEVEGWGPNFVTFNIKGKIATGRFTLIKMKPRGKDQEEWILVKNKDQNIKNK